MGRPIKKTFFGNLNTPDYGSVQNGSGIGGESVASVALNALGAFTTRPVFVFTAPLLPDGVTATGTITVEVESVTAVAGTATAAYRSGEIITFTDSQGNTATFTPVLRSAVLASFARATATTVSFTSTTTPIPNGTSIKITGASITGNMTIGGAAIAADQVYFAGAPSTGATACSLYPTYADALAGTNVLTIVTGTGTGGATFTFGTGTTGAGLAASDFTGLTVGSRGTFAGTYALDTGTQVTTASGSGAGQTATMRYRAKSVVITEPGRGYTAAPTSTPTESVSFTSVTLTSNVIDALAINSYIVGGSQRANGDIIKQEASRRYLVQNADGVGQCILATTSTLTAGTMNLIATDAAGNTYFVSKLTAHRAVLTQYLNNEATWEFADGDVAGWNITSAVTGVVSIAHTI
jgi:hypothetical protein